MLRTIVLSVVAVLLNFCVDLSYAAEPATTKPTTNATQRSQSAELIHQHSASTQALTELKHEPVHLADIEAHVKKHIGNIEKVLHEDVSYFVHIDVLWIKATAERPYHVLVTSGVSDEPMHVPEGMAGHTRVELVIALPKEWPLTPESFANENNYWPVRWLKQIGRLPHQQDTWLGWGHTIPNGAPAKPIANTTFTGVMLTPAYALPTEFFHLTTKSGDQIRFYALIPLYQEEMDFKLDAGAEKLEDLLEKHHVDFVIDSHRHSVIKQSNE